MAIKFDGNEYFNSGDLFYSDALTISVTIKPELLDTNARTILLKRNTGINGNSNEWSLTVSDTGVSFSGWNSSEQSTGSVKGTAIPLNQKTHVAVIVPASGNGASRMYYNGVLVATGVAKTTSMRNTNSAIQIGCRSNNDNNRYFKGEISKLACWNIAISSTNIPNLADPTKDVVLGINTSNLQFYLPMNEGINGTSAHGKTLLDRSAAKRIFTGNADSTNTGLIWVESQTPTPPVPEKPAFTNAFSTFGQIALTWNFVPTATSYTIKYGEASGNYNKTINVGNVNNYIIRDVIIGKTYYLILIANNANGASIPSNEVAATVIPFDPFPFPPLPF